MPKRITKVDINPKSESLKVAKMDNSFVIFGKSIKTLFMEWPVVTMILLIDVVLNILFVRGFSSGVNTNGVKNGFAQLFNTTNSAATNTGTYGYLINNNSTTSTPAAGAWQTVFVILFSLIIIWVIRQVLAGKRATVSGAFYKGFTQLVPFVLVLMLVTLELLPAIIGFTVLGLVLTNGIAANGFEHVLWYLLTAALSALTLYLLSSSSIALYIVTLNGMRPMQALRSAKKLVKGRRLEIIRKIIMLPLIILVLGAVLTIPVIASYPIFASWLLFVLSIIALAIVHSYMYTVYRQLL